MKFSIFSLLLVIAALSVRAEITEPCLATPIPITDRVSSSQAIIYGRVVSQRGVWDDAERSIYTINTVVVYDVWKGAGAVADTITVLTEGGDMGSYGRTVVGTLHLRVGDVGYLLLEHPREEDVTFSRAGVRRFHRPYAETQALLVIQSTGTLRDCWGETTLTEQQFENVVLADANHEVRAERLNAPADVRQTAKKTELVQSSVTFTPIRVIGGAGEIVTVRGNGFGAARGSSYVTFSSDGTNYHGADYAQKFVYRSWTDSSIVVEVPPSYNGTVRVVVGSTVYASADQLHITSNLSARTISPLTYTNHVNTNGKGGYTWSIDKALFDVAEARTCIESVMRQFRCKTGMAFEVSSEPTTAGYKLNDGVNAIIFDAPGYELGAGAVAYCDWIWYSCIVGNETFYYIRDADCRLSRRFDWYYGNGKNPQFGMAKLRYVLYHEIGHAHQFGHVNELGESMHPVVQALPAEDWLQRDTITSSEQRAGWYMTRNGRDFAFRGCGITPLLAPENTDCNNDPTSDVDNELMRSHEIELTPNPASDVVHVNLGATANPGTTVDVIDMLGVVRTHVAVPNGAIQIDLPVEFLPQGRYTAILRVPHKPHLARGFIIK